MEKNIEIFIKTDYIKLGQLLKYLGLISNGSESKFFLFNNEVLVNNEPENRRGRKIYNDYLITINTTTYIVKKG